MSEQQMAAYTLIIQADSGYESTTEGRCTAEQYGQAMAALHGTSPAQRKPLTDEEISDIWCKVSNTDFVTADTHEFARAIEAAHGIKGDA